MTEIDMSAALTWAREEIQPGYNIKKFAEALGIARTTYDAYEKGKAQPPSKVLQKIAEIRGLQPDWYKYPIKNARIREDRYRFSETPVTIPRVEVACIGFLTEGSLDDETMLEVNTPISIPANMWGPSHRIAWADQEDTGDHYPHKAVLIFDTESTSNIVGAKVAVKINGKKGSTLREVAWEDNRIVYRGLNGQKPLTRQEATETGLLVGKILIDEPGEFEGKYRLKGLP